MEEDNDYSTSEEVDEPFQLNIVTVIIISLAVIIVSSILISIVEANLAKKNNNITQQNYISNNL